MVHESTATVVPSPPSTVEAVTSAPTRRVDISVAPPSTTREPTVAPSSDAGVQATVKETTRSTAATSDALITFDALKSVAYQTGVYWVDFAK